MSMQETTCIEKQPLSQEMLEKMNAYWRAANYLSAGQLYLLDNPLLRKPLAMDQIKKKSSVTGEPYPDRISCTSTATAPSSATIWI